MFDKEIMKFAIESAMADKDYIKREEKIVKLEKRMDYVSKLELPLLFIAGATPIGLGYLKDGVDGALLGMLNAGFAVATCGGGAVGFIAKDCFKVKNLKSENYYKIAFNYLAIENYLEDLVTGGTLQSALDKLTALPKTEFEYKLDKYKFELDQYKKESDKDFEPKEFLEDYQKEKLRESKSYGQNLQADQLKFIDPKDIEGKDFQDFLNIEEKEYQKFIDGEEIEYQSFLTINEREYQEFLDSEDDNFII